MALSQQPSIYHGRSRTVSYNIFQQGPLHLAQLEERPTGDCSRWPRRPLVRLRLPPAVLSPSMAGYVVHPPHKVALFPLPFTSVHPAVVVIVGGGCCL
jgi:hypothetical protein